MKKQTTIALVTIIIAIGVASIPLAQNAEAESLIPDWIKNNAGWWADGTVDDTTFLNGDRKSTRLNSSHKPISYAVFCLKKKITNNIEEHKTKD